MSKLVDIYKSIYAAAGMKTSEDGYVSRVILEKTMPMVIGGKRLVLPTIEHQRNPDPENKLIGHFLREQTAKGPSPVMEALRESMSVRMSVLTGMIVYDLIDLAASQAKHAQMNPDQQEFLSIAKGADEEMTKRLMKILKAIPLNQTQKAFASIYVKWSAKLDGTTYKRGGIVNFPLYQELAKLDKTKEVYGVTLRGKDIDVIMATMKYIFPNIDTLNAYSHGSNSDVAPTSDALLGGLLKFAEQIHGVLDLFGNLLPSCADQRIDLDWAEAFEDLNALLPMIRSVPSQSGNDGASTRQEQAQEAAAANQNQVLAAPAPVAEKRIVIGQVPVAQAPAQEVPGIPTNPPPAPVAPATGKADISSLMRQPAMPVAAPYVMPGMPYGAVPGMVPGMMPPNGMHPGMMGQPGMGMPGVPMHPGMMPAAMPGMGMPMMGQPQPQFQGGHPGMTPPMGGGYPAQAPYPGMTGQFGHGVPFGYNPAAAPLHRY